MGEDEHTETCHNVPTDLPATQFPSPLCCEWRHKITFVYLRRSPLGTFAFLNSLPPLSAI